MSNKVGERPRFMMDIKDVMKYRDQLEIRIAAETNTNKRNKLIENKDVIDMVIDEAAFATLLAVAPEFKALTGRDFNTDILKLALPQARNVTDDTQIEIEYTTEEQPSKTKKIVVKKGDIPVATKANYMEVIQEMLSRKFTERMPDAIKLYIEHAGRENLMPADAWTEIRDMITDSPIMPTWDKHISVQCRAKGPVFAFKSVAKHVPEFGDTEISRIVEDSLKRTIADPKTEASVRSDLERILGKRNDGLVSQLYKQDEDCIFAVKQMLGFEATDILKPEDLKKVERTIGRIVTVMSPETRTLIERGQGRKPYVEKGYPAK